VEGAGGGKAEVVSNGQQGLAAMVAGMVRASRDRDGQPSTGS